jgi:hypothetical protein
VRPEVVSTCLTIYSSIALQAQGRDASARLTSDSRWILCRRDLPQPRSEAQRVVGHVVSGRRNATKFGQDAFDAIQSILNATMDRSQGGLKLLHWGKKSWNASKLLLAHLPVGNEQPSEQRLDRDLSLVNHQDLHCL